jgi:hypothetical protein
MAEEKDVANDPVEKPKAPRKKAAPKAKADPEQLAADIERTREDLAETLDAIADKVSPKRVAKRTTKKVTNAVKDTAHDAAEAVKDTASSAKDKVTGGGAKAATDWAPDPGADAVTAVTPVPDLEPEGRREVTVLPSPPLTPSGVSSWPAAPPSNGSLLKPEYIAAGAAAGLLAWWLLRRRK